MSDLSHLLGDVYGERGPDSPPVAKEPAADDRDQWERDDAARAAALKPASSDIDDLLRFSAPPRTAAAESPAFDDDLAQALSAALGDVPAPPGATADFDAPAGPAPVAAAAARPPLFPDLPPPPVRVPTPQPASGSGAAWSSPPQRATVESSAGKPMPAQHRLWQPGDDDILPSGAAKRSKR